MLQKSTIDFLKLLKKNNNKPWFDQNRTLYEAAKTDFQELVKKQIVFFSSLDTSYGLLKPSDCMFRINRDVRFSKDKSPYKTNFGAGFSIGGKKSNLAGFYLHIEPEHYFVGGGLWMPDTTSLLKVRQEIDYNWEELSSILNEKSFKSIFKELSGENKLKKPPKGYETENPAIEILKLKSFTAGTSFSEELILNKSFEKEINKCFKALQPFIEFINHSLKD